MSLHIYCLLYKGQRDRGVKGEKELAREKERVRAREKERDGGRHKGRARSGYKIGYSLNLWNTINISVLIIIIIK